jgi:hypothetical protein
MKYGFKTGYQLSVLTTLCSFGARAREVWRYQRVNRPKVINQRQTNNTKAKEKEKQQSTNNDLQNPTNVIWRERVWCFSKWETN